MGYDFCLPIPNEPAVELQLVEPVRCGPFGMQNRNQLAGKWVHRASPCPCERGGDHAPAMETWRKLPFRNIDRTGDGSGVSSSARKALSAAALDAKNHRQRKVQSLVGNQRRRRWHRIR